MLTFSELKVGDKVVLRNKHYLVEATVTRLKGKRVVFSTGTEINIKSGKSPDWSGKWEVGNDPQIYLHLEAFLAEQDFDEWFNFGGDRQPEGGGRHSSHARSTGEGQEGDGRVAVSNPSKDEIAARHPDGVPEGWQVDEDLWLFRERRAGDGEKFLTIDHGCLIRAFFMDDKLYCTEVWVAREFDKKKGDRP